jgi:hypothetical protein
MKSKTLFLLIATFFSLQYCAQPATDADYGNPAAEGFNAEESDEQAIAIADEVMEAMGGRAAWDATRYIQWTFFGRRTLLWDKQTGDVRIEVPADSTIYLFNIFDKTGKVLLNGTDISATDSLDQYLEQGESIWINDAYWLVMPYKLKDSGVTLKYMGQDTMQGGAPADVLQLTFQEVGRTPDNKYLVYVDKEDRLVKQWQFFGNYQDPEPRFTTPWEDYQQHGAIMLSGDRGRSKLTDIAVLESVPEGAFTDLAPIE